MRRATLAIGVLLLTAAAQPARPFLTSELLFPLEHWHNHGSASSSARTATCSSAGSTAPASARRTT